MSDGAQQREFAAWLEAGQDQSGDRSQPVPGVDPARLAVHRNTYVGTLVEALAQSLPVTRALAGAEFFDAMARERVLSDPPRSPVLIDYALSFPGFVHDFEPSIGTPVLAGMAQLEALRLRAFHAADCEALGLASFHPLACDAALLERTAARLHPAAHWLPARHPLLELWQLHDRASDPAALDLGAVDANRAEDILVHRLRHVVHMHPLPAGAIAFLDALAASASFAEAMGEAVASNANAEPAALFSLLLQHGLVTNLIDLNTENP